jgi:LacI family transcriptional regulator
LACDLNVSVVTVSKGLRGQSDISAATKHRILKHASEPKYLPNGIVPSLVSGRTHIIGLVVPDLVSSFFAEVAKGISEKVRPFGYQVVISFSEEDALCSDRSQDRRAQSKLCRRRRRSCWAKSQRRT